MTFVEVGVLLFWGVCVRECGVCVWEWVRACVWGGGVWVCGVCVCRINLYTDDY